MVITLNLKNEQDNENICYS